MHKRKNQYKEETDLQSIVSLEQSETQSLAKSYKK